MTLRARLTLWYATVLAGALLLFGVLVYLLLSYSLTLQIEESLKTTADEILLASRRNMRGVTLPALDLTGNVYVQVWGRDEDGQQVLVSTNLRSAGEPFDTDQLGTAARTFSTATKEGVKLRVLTVPVVVLPDNQIVGYLQLADSLGAVDRARTQLLFIMVPGGLFAVAVAALIGWMTAKTALRPLDQVTQAALQISKADDLSTRVSLTGPPEGEVGQLVVAINATLERLENLFEAQRRFLADVSHELRTPLTALRGNLDLIRRVEKVNSESLEAVSSEVDRMTRMVRDLLLLAQAESGKLPLGREQIELDTLLLEMYQEAKILGQGRVGIKLGHEDQVRVVGDRDRLKQVLLNLVDNAIRHTPDGGVVRLGLSKVEDWARITVSDTGPGIPQEELPHIFERFYRVDRSRARNEKGGAGLGLSIAHWIIRNHGGRIEVASQMGVGTTFSVWLPQNDDARSLKEPTQAGLEETPIA